MSVGTILILLSGLFVGQGQTQSQRLGPDDVWRLIRQAAAGIEDVTFEWEYSADLTGRELGDVPNPIEGMVGSGVVHYSFSGLVRNRITIEYTVSAAAGARTVQKVRRVWSWDGTQIAEKHFYPPPGKTVGRVIRIERKPDPDLVPYLADTSLTGFFLPMLQVCLEGASAESWRFLCRGWQKLDEQQCLVFSIFWDMEHGVEDRYYVDLSKGGHPARVEIIRNGRMIGVTRVLEWCQVDVGGTTRWYLPEKVETVELYCRKRLGPGKYVDLYRGEDDPFVRAVWLLRCDRVKVNTGLRREDIVVDLEGVRSVRDLTLAAVKAQKTAGDGAAVELQEDQPLAVPVDPAARKRVLDEQARSPDVLRSDPSRLWWRRNWSSVLFIVIGLLTLLVGVGGLWWLRRGG